MRKNWAKIKVEEEEEKKNTERREGGRKGGAFKRIKKIKRQAFG